jgi:hypothetical protein
MSEIKVLRLVTESNQVLVDLSGSPRADFGIVPPLYLGTNGNQLTPYVKESWVLFAQGTTESHIARSNKLSYVVTQCNRAAERGLDFVWLEWAMLGEKTRRCIIQNVSVQVIGDKDLFDSTLFNGILQIRFEFERTRFFETVSYWREVVTAQSLIGSKIELPAMGVSDGRVHRLSISMHTSNGAYIPRKFYMGFRPKFKGTTNFKPVWDLKNGTMSLGTSQTDAAANSGTAVRMQMDLAQSVRQLISYIKTSQEVTTNPEHMEGSYVMLLRYRTSGPTSGLIYSLGISYGVETVQTVPQDYILLPQATNYVQIKTHIINMPFWRVFNSDLRGLKNQTIFFDVLVEEGTATATDYLWIDSITFIPADRYMQVENGYTYTNTQTDLFGMPDETFSAYATYNDVGSPSAFGTPVAIGQAFSQNFVVPPEGGSLVIAGVDSSLTDRSDKTFKVNIAVEIVPRVNIYNE